MITATVSGNVGKSAEVRNAGGTPVCSFSVASNTKIKGEKTTQWISVSIFGKRGESLAQYISKGTKVAVSGELSTREYNGKTYLELNAHSIDLLGGGERHESNGAAKSSGSDYPDSDYGATGDDAPLPF